MTARYNTGPDSLSKIIADLSKRIDNIEAGNRISYTSIDSGSMKVVGGNFSVGDPYHVYFGNVTVGLETTAGWIFRRADLSQVFVLQGNGTADQFWAMYDNLGNIIISDDGFTDQGLARPYIPLPVARHSNLTFDTTTASTTMTGLYTLRFYKQQPRVRVMMVVKSSDGSTPGEIQLYNVTRDEIIQGPDVVTAGTTTFMDFGPSAVTGNHMEDLTLEIQARRTAGAGTIGIIVMGAYGQQS